MRARAINWTVVLALLTAAGLGGWFVGSDIVAPQPQGAPVTIDRQSGEELDPQALAAAQQSAQQDAADEDASAADPSDDDDTAIVAGRVTVDIDETIYPNPSLVLGASGFSPFGHPDGLRGRQVLAGRVIAVDGERVTIETATGTASIVLAPSSPFLDGSPLLVRLQLGNASQIEAGAAVALILNDDGHVTAALVLPADSRPTLYSGPPVLGGQGEDESDSGS